MMPSMLGHSLVIQMLETQSDLALMEKVHRVYKSSTSDAHTPVLLEYLRLAKKRAFLGSTKALLSGWINNIHIKEMRDKRLSSYFIGAPQ